MAYTHHHDVPVPRGPLIGAALLIGVTLAVVATIRLGGIDISSRSEAPVVAARDLRFEDQADGSIRVLEVGPGQATQVLRVVEAGSNGFLRGTLRALVRKRRAAGLGAETPFHLVAHADGRLTLEDPATTERVDLESFGPTNASVFAELLATVRPLAAAR